MWPWMALSREGAHWETHTSSTRHYRSVEGVKWHIMWRGILYKGDIGGWKGNKRVAEKPCSFKLCHFMSCLLEVIDFAESLFYGCLICPSKMTSPKYVIYWRGNAMAIMRRNHFRYICMCLCECFLNWARISHLNTLSLPLRAGAEGSFAASQLLCK